MFSIIECCDQDTALVFCFFSRLIESCTIDWSQQLTNRGRRKILEIPHYWQTWLILCADLNPTTDLVNNCFVLLTDFNWKQYCILLACGEIIYITVTTSKSYIYLRFVFSSIFCFYFLLLIMSMVDSITSATLFRISFVRLTSLPLREFCHSLFPLFLSPLSNLVSSFSSIYC